jgi:ribonuclease P protein component
LAASARSLVATSLKLPRARRLRQPWEFKRAYALGQRLGNALFTAVVQPNGLTAPRLGMSIAARVVRRAVQRNRLRRVIRESFRAHQCELPALDLVIGVRASAVSAESARLRAALEQLWQKVASACRG